MMRSLILRTATTVLLGLMLLFSIFILLRGHNEPGGGFIGGLIASTAFSLHSLAFGPKALRRLLRIVPRTLITAGLATALVSGLVGMAGGDPFLTGRWAHLGGALAEKGIAVGTPLVFDIGVYLVVVGAVLTVVQALQEDG
jgi:multicomponent Na+:H+ antiporter subunit B